MRAARPEVAFGADLIAGFPTETDAMFDNTLNLIGEAGLTVLHVFPFSPRNGTPAARMPQIPKAVAKSRAAQLRARGDAAMATRMTALNGTTQTLLVERGGIGRTECFAPARIDAPPGTFMTARITGAARNQLLAQAA